MDIAATTAAAAPTGGAAKTSEKGVISSDFETFLKMLTAQMQNQDPLNPMESTDFAVQLATFSGVEQQVRTNDLLGTLGSQFDLMGMSQLAGWVGMDARAAAPAMFDGAPIGLSPNPPVAADRAVLIVADSLGREVSRSDIPVSNETIQWAGVGANGQPLPNGVYSFSLESYSGGNLMTTQTVETYGKIAEARSEGGSTVLIMQGGVRVPVNDVTALRGS